MAVGSTSADLGSLFHRGLTMSLLNTLLSRLGVFLLGILLARLLAPSEFGAYAAALVVQLLFQSANEVGSAAAIVRRRGEIRSLLPTAWTMSVVWGAVGAAVVLGCAPLIASGLGSPDATGLIRFMAINMLVEGFASVPAAVLTRNLLQSRRLVADLSGNVVNVGLTAALALSGFGPWSLVIGLVTGTAVVVMLLLVLSGTRPTFGFDRRCAREVAGSGVAMTGSLVLLMALQLTPQTVTGSVLGATALGFFYLAFNIANWPASMASTTLERVALAAFSRVREGGGDVAEAAGVIIAMISGAVLTGGLGLALLAHELVTVVYGPTWAPAVDVLAALAVASVAKALAELVFSVLVANGSGGTATLPQLAWLLVLVPAAVLGAHRWGLPGVGWAQAAVAFGFAIPLHLWFLRSRGGVSLVPFIRACRLPLVVSAGTAAVLVALRALSPWPVLTLCAGGALTAGAIVLLYLLMRGGITASLAVEHDTAGRSVASPTEAPTRSTTSGR